MGREEFREREIPLWEEMLKSIFDGKVPLKKEWHDSRMIVDILNAIGENKASNHTFLPDSGGLDLLGAGFPKEKGCIEIDFDGTTRILKPKKLTFNWFEEADYEWAYFMIETDQLKPSGVYEGETEYS